MAHVLKASQQEADVKHPDTHQRHYGLRPQQAAGWSLLVQLPAHHHPAWLWCTTMFHITHLESGSQATADQNLQDFATACS